MDLMTSFPVAHSIFTDRAIHRRIEFRRIKKQFELMANIHQSTDQDKKNLSDPEKFEIKYYNDHSPSSEIPPFLTEANFYFTKKGLHDLVSN